MDVDAPAKNRKFELARRPNPIELRRFAGTLSHSEQLAQVRVAHLTDQHVGRVTPLSVQRAAVELTNAQNPDLIALTGDFVCHSQAYLDQLGEVIAGFDAPVFAVLGNHDYWSGASEVRRVLHRAGAEILDNAHTTITIRGDKLQVLGLDDAYTGHADRRKALKGLDRSAPTLGLSHIAEEADGLWDAGVSLVLSGHTHAGQITLARLHELAVGKIAGHKYVHGLYGCRSRQRADGAVYVGAGIGAAVMPLRIGERARREVALFDLGHEPGSFDEHHDEQPAQPGRKPSMKTKLKRNLAVRKKHERREKRQKRAEAREASKQKKNGKR
ncbi:MAG: metallophosphoesterase [Myxococcota bacterium]